MSEWVMAHVWISHGTCLNKSWHIRWLGFSSCWATTRSCRAPFSSSAWSASLSLWVCVLYSIYTYIYICIHTCLYTTPAWREFYMCDMTLTCVWHDSFICVTWRIYMRSMTHPHVWHDSSVCVMWLTSRSCQASSSVSFSCFVSLSLCVCNHPLVCLTQVNRMYVTHPYVWHDSSATWLIRTCDITHPQVRAWRTWRMYVWHDAIVCVTWLIHRGVQHIQHTQRDNGHLAGPRRHSGARLQLHHRHSHLDVT